MSVSLQLRFPWIHINGKVQEIEVSEEIDIPEDIQLIEVIEQEESTFDPQKDFLNAESWDVQKVPPSKDPLFDILGVIKEIETYVVQSYARIIRTQVSFVTGKNEIRYLQIHFSVDRKMRSRQLTTLKRQISEAIRKRVDPQIKVVAFELKDVSQNDSNDPPS